MEVTHSPNDACRLCDQNCGEMHSIFEKNHEGLQILHLIKDCLPIIIYRTDPLSKQICDTCFVTLDKFYKLKKSSVDTAEKQSSNLRESEDNKKSVQLYLACENDIKNNSTLNSIRYNIPGKASTATATEDLKFSCTNCNSSVTTNEMELCAELHKAIADSLHGNPGEPKPPRARRRRSQAFYHELEDSLCSSLTEYTNTEDSQGYDNYNSDENETCGSDSEPVHRSKRRKLNLPEEICNGSEKTTDKDLEVFRAVYADEIEYRYTPLSLMTLALNVINKNIDPEHDPEDFLSHVVLPECTYCKEAFRNSKLLAMHEVGHINIELGEKIDNPVPWHESRDDAAVRNLWLNSYDDEHLMEEQEEETEDDNMEVDTSCGNDLLIPVGTEIPQEHQSGEEIVLIMGQPTVNGISLSDYTKDERKSFYKTMKVGNLNKKFCALCRYSFKDNWAIESHYFSLACYFTCRYCGMRFNKQRQQFDEHVSEHEKQGDQISTKVYSASKLSNFYPRVISNEKVVYKKDIPVINNSNNSSKKPQIRVKTFPQQTADIPIKQEKLEVDDNKILSRQLNKPQSISGSSAKPTNQAYFCRKCYKVFFNLNEFNLHSKNCDYNTQILGGRSLANPNTFSNVVSHNNTSTSKTGPSKKPPTSAVNNMKNLSLNDINNKNGEMLSPSGRPMRHCVKEVSTYRDETYVSSERVVKEPPNSAQSFVCFICNTPFPTIYSRNSHMRIHKGETLANKGPVAVNHHQQPPQRTYGPRHNSSATNDKINSRHSFHGFVNVKQEPLEPEVQIHESEQSYATSIGAVSITPISKNPNQKATINPNIMKLVQNNPHLTIRANSERQPVPGASGLLSTSPDIDKSYKCSSCWEAFANKSHLYFHKKNQCEGSKYPCPFCKKRFGTEAAYSSHIFYSHPE